MRRRRLQIEDNTAAPPSTPFYEEREERGRRHAGIGTFKTARWLEKRRAEYAEIMKKPVGDRPGGLKTRADYTDEEWARLVAQYEGKGRR